MGLHVKGFILRTFSLSLVATSVLYAQTPPTVGDILRQVEPPRFVEPQRLDDVPSLVSPEAKSTEETVAPLAAPATPASTASSFKAIQQPRIEGFVFVGNEALNDAQLQEALAAFVGKPLTVQEILAAEEALSTFYQSNGFPNARAFAFSDAIHHGVVTLAVRARSHDTLNSDPQRLTQNTPEEALYGAIYPGILVTRFAFEGNEAISDTLLRAQLSLLEGRTLDTQKLLEAAQTITTYYQSRGFKNARAYLFKHNIAEDGTVTFSIRARHHETHAQDPALLQENETLSMQTVPVVLMAPLTPSPESVEKKHTVEETVPFSTLVRTFTFEGNTAISTQELEALVAPHANKSFTLAELETLTSHITKHYRTKGYFVARAYLPPQTIENETLNIAIIEGNYGTFHITNTSRVKESIIQGMMDAIKDRDIVSTDTLERAMLLINDTPGARITQADVSPGTVLGTSDFTITAEASAPYGGYLLSDNHGSPYTGKIRFMGGLFLHSPFKVGDRLSINGLLSENTNLDNGRIAYAFPLHYSGTRGELSYAHTTYNLGGTYRPLDAQGKSDALALEITHPFIRSRKENLWGFASFALKTMKDEIRSVSDTTKKDASAATFGVRYDQNSLFFTKDASHQASLAFTLGDLNYKDKTKDVASTQGSYQKLNLELSQSLLLSPLWTWNNALRAQYALNNKNLDGSEDFSIGGNGGIKVYPDGELSAEKGYMYTTELLYTLPYFRGISHQAGVFYGIGRAYMSDNTVGFEARTLQNAGVSYYAFYRSFFLRTHLASRIDGKEIQSESNYRTRFLVQGGWTF